MSQEALVGLFGGVKNFFKRRATDGHNNRHDHQHIGESARSPRHCDGGMKHGRASALLFGGK